jgi:uncharacterized OsmC-like protein
MGKRADNANDSDALRLVVEGTVCETGTEFFRALVKNLAAVMDTPGAWVTEYLPELRRLRAHAFWLNGAFLPHYEHALNGTACQATDAIAADPAKGQTNWKVSSHWRGGTRSDAVVKACKIGGTEVAKDFTIRVDEPLELGGTNQYANPQEYLVAALNACMIVGYSAVCAREGIELEDLRIETEGDIDLQGFLGIDPAVPPGYEQLRYTVFVKGNATPEQFEKVHRTVMATSPNYFNLSDATPLKPRLVIGSSGSLTAK